MATLSTRPVTRETSAYVRDRGMRPLVVTIIGSIIELRPKGCRSREALDLSAAWGRAVKERVAREKAEKRASRKGSKSRK